MNLHEARTPHGFSNATFKTNEVLNRDGSICSCGKDKAKRILFYWNREGLYNVFESAIQWELDGSHPELPNRHLFWRYQQHVAVHCIANALDSTTWSTFRKDHASWQPTAKLQLALQRLPPKKKRGWCIHYIKGILKLFETSSRRPIQRSAMILRINLIVWHNWSGRNCCMSSNFWKALSGDSKEVAFDYCSNRLSLSTRSTWYFR